MAQLDEAPMRTLGPVESWQVMTMRVTAFPNEPFKADEQSWWRDLVGSEPETVISRVKVGEYRAEGGFEGRQLSLSLHLDRIDWNLAPIMDVSEGPPPMLPLAGPFPEVLTSFRKIIDRWLPLSPPMSRLAFGAVLAKPVEDRRSGYLHIAMYLPNVKVDPEGSSDLFYQINRPRPSKTGIERLHNNRLMKWSVMSVRLLSMALQQTAITTVDAGGDSACRLELDINTAPAFGGPLPADKLPEILSELVDLAHEIATKGDIS